MERLDIFLCSICHDKADDQDDPTEYMHPLSELANPEEPEELWICKECNQDLIDEKAAGKYEEFTIMDGDLWG